MNTQFLVSTALVTTQVSRQPQTNAGAPAAGSSGLIEVPSVSVDKSLVEAAQAPRTSNSSGKPAAPQSAPNSALTTYRDQDSGRIIVRVYDRESGDVLVEFPPEKAFRPAGTPVAGAAAKPKTSFSI